MTVSCNQCGGEMRRVTDGAIVPVLRCDECGRSIPADDVAQEQPRSSGNEGTDPQTPPVGQRGPGRGPSRPFRKKPVVIRAAVVPPQVNYDGGGGSAWRAEMRDDAVAVAQWCGGKLVALPGYEEHLAIDIETLEGVMRADPGDYVIQGVQGEFYPCKPGIFRETYEEANRA